jgi:hypothetical protein
MGAIPPPDGCTAETAVLRVVAPSVLAGVSIAQGPVVPRASRPGRTASADRPCPSPGKESPARQGAPAGRRMGAIPPPDGCPAETAVLRVVAPSVLAGVSIAQGPAVPRASRPGRTASADRPCPSPGKESPARQGASAGRRMGAIPPPDGCTAETAVLRVAAPSVLAGVSIAGGPRYPGRPARVGRQAPIVRAPLLAKNRRPDKGRRPDAGWGRSRPRTAARPRRPCYGWLRRPSLPGAPIVRGPVAVRPSTHARSFCQTPTF